MGKKKKDINDTPENDFGWGEMLTRDHFLYFAAAGRLLLDFFHLSDFEISFQFADADEDDPRAATLITDFGNRIGSIILYDHWDRKPTDYNLWLVAFHEVLEVLFSDVSSMASERSWDEVQYDREHHRVIRILEKTVFERMWMNGHDLFNFQPLPEGGHISRPDISKMVDKRPSMHDTRVQCDKCGGDGRIDSVPPLQGPKKRRNVTKAK